MGESVLGIPRRVLLGYISSTPNYKASLPSESEGMVKLDCQDCGEGLK